MNYFSKTNDKQSLRPKDDFDALGRGMDQWFDSVLSGWPSFRAGVTRHLAGPAVDLQDQGDHYLVKVDAPGMEKKDLKVRVQGSELVIEGSREEEKKEEDPKRGYLRSERYSGGFCRVMGLPSEVDSAKAKAVYKDGVLVLTLPKQQPLQEKSGTIEIS